MHQREMLRYTESKTAANSRGSTSAVTLRTTDVFACGTGYQVVLEPPLALLACYGGLAIWDLADPADPVPLMGNVETWNARNVAVANQEAFVLSGDTHWSKLHVVMSCQHF
jgi:hypothetical protein